MIMPELSEQVVGKQGYGPRPQVSRQMTRVGFNWVGRCCLSIVTLGHDYPMPRLSVHHLLRDSCQKLPTKRISFLPNKYKKTQQHFCNEDKNNEVHQQIKMHLKNITKIEKYKKTRSTKYQRINTQPIKSKKQSNTLVD